MYNYSNINLPSAINNVFNLIELKDESTCLRISSWHAPTASPGISQETSQARTQLRCLSSNSTPETEAKGGSQTPT